MIFTNGADQSAKCQTFDCAGEISPNSYFDRVILLNVHKVSAKRMKELFHDTKEWCKI